LGWLPAAVRAGCSTTRRRRRIREAVEKKTGSMDAEAARQLAEARLAVDEIVPGQLFLGGKRGAADLEALRARGVTHVVNCTSLLHEGALEDFHSDTLEYHRLPLIDRPQCLLLPLLPAALEWAQAAVAGGGVVYAHCNAGSSRSGAFAVAFVMQAQRMTYADALAAVRECRPSVALNAGLAAHLRAFQQSVDGLPPAAPLSAEELQADAQEFADAAMVERMNRGEEWGEWTGHADYRAAIEEALACGETDWVAVEAALGMSEPCEEERGGFEEGEPPPIFAQ
jgi:hypothetical protein